MAKISTYVIDGSIVDDDKVIGSDANSDLQTKNYRVGDLVGYFAASIGNDYLVPYIGAMHNVDLGAFSLSATNITISGNFIADGTAGLPGQALLSTGPGSPATWGYVVGSQDLNSVLNIGNTGDKNINLITKYGYAKIDVEKIYGQPAMYLYNDALGTTSNWATDNLHLEDSVYKADYYANKIRYTFGSNYVDLILNSYNNQSFILPAVGGFIPVSVNGNFSDASGNINVPIGGGGTVTNIDTSAPLTGGPINVSGTIGITQSNSSTDGYLSSADWNYFDSKQDPITLTTTGTSGAATFIGNTLNIPNYSGGSGTIPPLQDVATQGNSYTDLLGTTLEINKYVASTPFDEYYVFNYYTDPGGMPPITSYIRAGVVDGSIYLDRQGSFGYRIDLNTDYLSLNNSNTGNSVVLDSTKLAVIKSGDITTINLPYLSGGLTGTLPLTVNGVGALADGSITIPTGGGTNPTDTYIPYNNAGTFADSYLINDTVLGILKTNYSGTDKGIYLDFVNNEYYLGDTNYFIKVNTSVPNTTISTLSGTGTQMVVADASGILSRQDIPLGTVTGSGTLNYVSKWDSTGTNLVDSQILDDGVYVRIGNGGGSMGFPYETLILEKNGDVKFGVYTSVNTFGAGGSSIVLGATGTLDENNYFPGFEFQFSPAYVADNNFIRYNFIERNTLGNVIASNQNIFNIYADGRASFQALVNGGTSMVVADSAGFISTQPIPSGGGGTVTNIATSSPLTGGPITTSGTIGINQSGASQDGYLSSTDWNTFNGKQATLSGTGIVKSTAGTISYITDNSTNWDAAYTNRITSLTTTGTGAATLVANVLNIPTPPTATFTSLTVTGNSGASTLLAGVLNVPTYTLSGLGGQPLATNLTSLSGLTYASTSFVKMTAAGTFALDTNVYYLASNPSGFTNNTGTVTSVAALTLGTSGTDVSSTVANGTTTPVITLNIPDASATARGLMTSAQWTTFTSKQAAITGAATTITSSNLTASRAVISNASGKIDISATTDTELGYVSGVTSSIQTQINGKVTDSAWVDYSATSTIVGFTAFAVKLIQYRLLGNKTMIVQFQIESTAANGSGTASSFTLPFNASAWGTQYFIYHSLNNTITQSAAVATLAASSNVVTFYPTAATGSSWATATTRHIQGQIIVNIA